MATSARRIIDLEEQTIPSPTLISGIYQSVKFTRCTFQRDVTFYNVEVFSEVDFIECTFIGFAKLIFESGKFHEPISMGFRSLSMLYIRGGDFKNLHLGHWGSLSTVKEVTVERLSECSGSIQLSRSSIEKINIIGENSATFISMQDLTVNSLNLCYFHTTVPIRMFNIRALKVGSHNAEFNIHHSTLGASVFFSVDFDSFDKFNIRQCFIGETKFINCFLEKGISAEVGNTLGRNPYEQLKSDIKNIEAHADALKRILPDDADIAIMRSRIEELSKGLESTKTKEEKDVVMFRRENYKQMKISAQSIGDSVNEKKFHALEMNEYLKMETRFSDRLILWLSMQSSNFGQSLWRPIVFHICIFHAILFAIYFAMPNSEGYYFSWTDSSWRVFQEGFSTFCFLISPFRDLTADNHGFLDLAFRVNAGFFLYNILRATRKFYH